MLSRIASLIRRVERSRDGYSRDLQVARLRASYQRAYFAPALFNLVPVKTDLIGSMAVDRFWRLYYNESWVATHSVEENAAVLIHEVGHLLRDHEARKRAAAIRDERLWNTAADCEINDDLAAEELPLPGDPPHPAKYGSRPDRARRFTTTNCSNRAAPAATIAKRGRRREPSRTAGQALMANGGRGSCRTMQRAPAVRPGLTR